MSHEANSINADLPYEEDDDLIRNRAIEPTCYRNNRTAIRIGSVVTTLGLTAFLAYWFWPRNANTKAPTQSPTQTPTSTLPPHMPTHIPTWVPTQKPTRAPTQNCTNPESDLNYALTVDSNPETYNVDINLINNGNISWLLNVIEFFTNIRIPHDALSGLSTNFTIKYYNTTNGIKNIITTDEPINIPENSAIKISYTLPQPINASDLSATMLLPPDDFGTSLNKVSQNVVYENSDKCARRNITQQFSADGIIENSDVNTYVLSGVYIQDSGEVNCYNVSEFNQRLSDGIVWKKQMPNARDIILSVEYNALGPTNNSSQLNAFTASLQNPLQSINPIAIVLDQTNAGSSVKTPIYTPEYETALVSQVAAVKNSLERTGLQLIEPFNESLSNKTTQEIMNTVDYVWQPTYFDNPNIKDTPLEYRNTPLSELNVTQFPPDRVDTMLATQLECTITRDPINPSNPMENINSGANLPGGNYYAYGAMRNFSCDSEQTTPVGDARMNYSAKDSPNGANSVPFNSLFSQVCTGTGSVDNLGKLIKTNDNVHIQGADAICQLKGSNGKMFDQVAADFIRNDSNYTNARNPQAISDGRSAGRNPNALFSDNNNRKAAGIVGMAVISLPVIIFSIVIIMGLAGACYIFQCYKNNGQNKTTENDVENPKTDQDNMSGKKFS